MAKCSILVCSCDKNEDIWQYFFYFFKKYYSSCNYPIYLNTEEKKYQDKDLNVISLQKHKQGDPQGWSQRLRDYLNAMTTDYVIILLEDFFLTDYVRVDEVERCIRRMDDDPQIANFIFDSGRHMCIDSEFPEYLLQERKAPFRLSLQAGIWRREILLKYLRNHESPWQFELWGSKRARRWSEKSFVLKEDQAKVFSYPSGGAIADNRWRGDEICCYMRKNGFDIDFNERGVYRDGDDRKTEIVQRSTLKKIWQVFKSLI